MLEIFTDRFSTVEAYYDVYEFIVKRIIENCPHLLAIALDGARQADKPAYQFPEFGDGTN